MRFLGDIVPDRLLPDWIPAYLQYGSVTEAPRRMHFWSAVSAIAGALRRRVWLDMKRFMWTPSFYVVFVAPPGIVSKSTTADISMDILRQVPGIKFGPDAVTWQALVTAFGGASEQFEYEGEFYPMSPITLVATELGNLVNLQDREMVNLLITLWDGRKQYEKQTKMSGNDNLDAPWINMIACTTPHWVAENMPPSMIGGGLSSRCVFVYADEKEKYVPYVDEVVEKNDAVLRTALLRDLEAIAQLTGPFIITPEARDWGREWYVGFWKSAADRMDDKMLEGYAARKQTHLHKLAMVLSASRGDSLRIETDDLQVANIMLEEIEQDMHRVFSRIGRSENSLQVDRLLAYVVKKGGVPYEEAYRVIHGSFPDFRDFEGVVMGLIRSGQIEYDMPTMMLKAKVNIPI